ncbi:glycoside hydrolase family 9 protein [Parapedobacter pyrenivorans]|uniref:glycoside hydrolase family 9 protein n=1 Tax=Parapedobacter pyrenivorans TaxID=1305674 RepID=UPI003340DE79
MALLKVLVLFAAFAGYAQPFQFAHVTDTHVGSATGADDLRRTVADINANPDLHFVILSGDVTEFGSDEELRLAKQILDSLLIPWYVIPGNHDTNWSESGGNSFRKIFGGETFAFVHNGYFFVGTNSGPNMRMSPGQVPRENLVWMDSLFAAHSDKDMPIIYVNHYPQDSSLNNWFEALDRVKTRNVQLFFCGHGHQNKQYEFEGIPGIMGRSNLRAKDSVGGYNIVTIADGRALYQEQHPGAGMQEPWAVIPLLNHHFADEARLYNRPDYSVNTRHAAVREVWSFQDASDIGAGLATYKQLVITANTAGQVYAVDEQTGRKVWTFQTGGKVYSTPAVWKHYVVVGSSDGLIYGLHAKTGKLLWKHAAEKAVLGSPLVHNGVAYIGASDGRFRALDIKSGRLRWSFDEVKGYVSGKPLLYENTLYFGSWGNGFYAIDPADGHLKWQWSNGASSRMLSPAACYPVGANGRIFIVAPDRYMTALDARNGAEIWRKKIDSVRVRESMGLSEDGTLVYVKTMDGQVLGVLTTADSMQIAWRSKLQLPYELTPSAISADNGLVFVPSHSGLVSGLNAGSGDVAWQYKLSNGMVNPMLPLRGQRLVASTMDGKVVCLAYGDPEDRSWIRVNQLGYTPQGIKVAVWGGKSTKRIARFRLVEGQSGKPVFAGKAGKDFGAYGPFRSSYRLDFSAYTDTGTYYLEVDGVRSPQFRIGDDVYKGAADFALRYMRQQRTLFNPFLKDSCHTHDGFTLYAAGAGLPDSTRIDVGGGWHDASDYLQYATTSANATYHLLAAYRDFPAIFGDHKQANGLDGSNGIADVLDEARWGLDWLLKMHPEPHLLFNQIADDRDHAGMRMPGEDDFYGRGFERPVYFVSGEPQQRGKFMNSTTGTSSTAAKFTSAFNLGSALFETKDTTYAQRLLEKAKTAYAFAKRQPGVTQTASVKSPYIYAEDNWVDDMELAAATQWAATGDAAFLQEALDYARQETVTPWMANDTAAHYQWYPFINLGHRELARQTTGEKRDEVIAYYKEGIEQVWARAEQNAFYRGVPFIWCSNNLTASFAIQCLWYEQLTNDDTYAQLAQANFDWLFGCNPWGTSMVYGLPAWGDTPADPHSAFTRLGNYPIDGGLVDGPVYGNIFNSLIGIQLTKPDAHAPFQSDLAVYHDDYGDYSTNEPTMDGTASLIYLLASKEQESREVAQPKK